MAEHVVIPWSEMPAAVRNFLWCHAPHMLDRDCRYTMMRDGSLLIEEVSALPDPEPRVHRYAADFDPKPELP